MMVPRNRLRVRPAR